MAIKTSSGAGSAAKTVPTPKPLAKTQDLVFISQVTEAAPPPTVLATATITPPLILGSTSSIIGCKIIIVTQQNDVTRCNAYVQSFPADCPTQN